MISDMIPSVMFVLWIFDIISRYDACIMGL